MTTWKDVLKVLVCCGAVLFLVMGIIWAFETDMEIRSLREDVKDLQATQRPLVAIDGGKYLTVFTHEKEVIIETRAVKEDGRN